MSVLDAVILGVVQGVTEFLPVSSTGHLILAQQLLGIRVDSLLLVTCLHAGTLVAVVWALWPELCWVVRHPTSRATRMLVLAMVPTGLIGIGLEDAFERVFNTGVTLGLEFVLTGIILWWMDAADHPQTKSEPGAMDALWIGTFQAFAIMPALSRSGLTMAGALWRGLNRDAAGRFSFLISVPAILGATLVQALDWWDEPAAVQLVPWGPVMIATAAAAVSGYAAVKGTLWLLRTARMRWFALYVWVVAALVLADQWVWHRWFPPLSW
ncbi:MAG: undecaprenyl-diphosphate phosphatase [Alicyclobacillaceae bacterium]|nr:undecaprenyl-diphosphate phosphatase [Alicyclobacillaceae bacterium]